MLRERGHPAGARERACVRGRAPVGAGESGQAHRDLPVRTRRQGHAHPAGHIAARRGTHVTGERIGAAIRSRNASGDPALVAFLTAGYPSRDRFLDDLRAIAANADLVEIGVPFTDPMADGVTIQRATHAALRSGVTLGWILEQVADARAEVPLLLMSYLNPLLAFGLPRLARVAARAGISGFIVPDLPLEECDSVRSAFGEEGLALVQMVTPVT